jgi:hypothetical protein
MKKPMILLLAAAAAFLVAADGLGEPTLAPNPSTQKQALDSGLAKATATLDAAVKLRLERAALETVQARDAAAQALRAEARRLGAPPTIRPPHVSPNAPVISDVYATSGAAPLGLVILFGANLKAADGSNEIHVMLGQQDLRAQPLSGNACTRDRCEVTMPDFDGITGLTPATIVFKQGGMSSEPANLMLRPELVAQALDLAQLKPALLQDFRGEGLVYSETLTGPDVFRLLDGNTIQGVHRRPYGARDASGEDEFFLATQLKNNWVLKDVVFFDAASRGPDANPGQWTAGYSNVKWGTAWLYIDVAWFNMTSTYNQSAYYIRYVIEGPKGTAYY